MKKSIYQHPLKRWIVPSLLIIIGILLAKQMGFYLDFSGAKSQDYSSPSPIPTIFNNPSPSPLIQEKQIQPKPVASPKEQSKTAVVIPTTGNTIYCLSDHASEVKNAADLVDSKGNKFLEEAKDALYKCGDKCSQNGKELYNSCMEDGILETSQCSDSSSSYRNSCYDRCKTSFEDTREADKNRLKPFIDSLGALMNKYCK